MCGEEMAGWVGVDEGFGDADLAARARWLRCRGGRLHDAFAAARGRVSRMSTCRVTRLGTLLTAPG